MKFKKTKFLIIWWILYVIFLLEFVTVCYLFYKNSYILGILHSILFLCLQFLVLDGGHTIIIDIKRKVK